MYNIMHFVSILNFSNASRGGTQIWPNVGGGASRFGSTDCLIIYNSNFLWWFLFYTACMKQEIIHPAVIMSEQSLTVFLHSLYMC